MISRLDNVVLRDVALLTLVCVLGLTFLFTALSLYQIVNRFEVTPRFGTLVSFAPSLWVSLLPMTLPMSALFAATLVFGRMRAERELLLLAASGVTPWRPFVMLVPIGIVACAISWFGVSEFGPKAYADRHSLERQALADFIDHPPQGPRELHFPGGGGPDPSFDISYARVDDGFFNVADVDPDVCKGCDALCVTVCIKDAIQLHPRSSEMAQAVIAERAAV